MPTSLLQDVRADIVEVVVERLNARARSGFRRIGGVACRRHVESVLDALVSDLASGGREAVRRSIQALIDELAGETLTFSDLRFFAKAVRDQVIAAVEAVEAAPEAVVEIQQINDWLFEMVLVATMRYVVQHEAQQQKRTVEREMQRLETRLAESESALAEKTRLLELIREASTPIAPVVQGILVVPLVGTFDALRAEMLTEKLLEEISRLHAQAAIIDISGVPVFDTTAAELIIRLARTVQLLGAEVFLVGMSPGTARTIVDLEIDLAGLRTHSTLQDGLAAALVLRRQTSLSLETGR